MSELRTRLADLRRRAGLSRREYAAWLGVPKSTMESWLRNREPQSYTRAQIEPVLAALERELARKKPRLPVPLSIGHKDRFDYVRSVRDYYR